MCFRFRSTFYLVLAGFLLFLLHAQMRRAPVGPRRSPGAPRPASDWTFPGIRSPFGGSPQRRGPRDVPVERYFSPSMLQDPWRMLQPVTPEAAARTS
ncbi:M-phase-specific PLK1-interacting protein isoform X2 [Gambusia affinis]|uniref:M-phase-specific PLK1-interacting protein isoform X2 n=1 Tax=Gambusia affinis TaxID=33528 RepID=UPI001CDD0123|nr:M-phase-specific PLK1-interacting protein isoform X2 [Gambusia affinis]